MVDAPEVSSHPAVESLLSDYQLIPIAQIKPSRHQARKSFDEDSLKRLAESIKLEGLQQPITVRVYSVDGSRSTLYELVSGERRLRAVKLLGRSSIEAHVIEVPSEASAAAKGLIENLQREDLNPIEEAEGFQELLNMKDEHWTQTRLAEVTGKGQSHISEALSVLKLPKEIVESIRQRIITLEHGVELLRLNNAKEQKRMALKVGKKDLTVKQTREAIDRKLGKSSKDVVNPPPKAAGVVNGIDPLADVWVPIHQDLSFAPDVYWEVKYGDHKPVGGPPLKGWHFFAMPTGSDSRQALIDFFHQLSQALKGSPIDPALPEIVRQAKAAEPSFVETREPSWISDTPVDLQELESIAVKEGPKGVYRKLFKAGCPLIEMAPNTWEEGGFKDPQEGLRQVLAILRRMQGH